MLTIFQSLGDDEYDYWKAEASREMKKRMGLHGNPLDNVFGRTSKSQYMFQYFLKVVSTQFRTLNSAQVVSLVSFCLSPLDSTKRHLLDQHPSIQHDSL